VPRYKPIVVKYPLPCVAAAVIFCETRGAGMCLSLHDPPKWAVEVLNSARYYTLYFAIRGRLYEAGGRLVRRRGSVYHVYVPAPAGRVLRQLRAEGYQAVCLVDINIKQAPGTLTTQRAK
jgi:hypothetical protein